MKSQDVTAMATMIISVVATCLSAWQAFSARQQSTQARRQADAALDQVALMRALGPAAPVMAGPVVPAPRFFLLWAPQEPAQPTVDGAPHAVFHLVYSSGPPLVKAQVLIAQRSIGDFVRTSPDGPPFITTVLPEQPIRLSESIRLLVRTHSASGIMRLVIRSEDGTESWTAHAQAAYGHSV